MKESKMDCQRVEDLISSYIENDLSPELYREVSLHLEQCQHCQQLKETIEDIITTFPDLEEDVPFFLKNRLYYIPESQEVLAERIESKFYFLKWLAAAIGTVVLFLNLFYFTNIYPPAKRLLHSVVAQVKTFTVETGAFIDEVKESDGTALLTLLKKENTAERKAETTIKEEGDYPLDLEKSNPEIDRKIESKGGKNG
jgi:predicted anti-sigma-YlaC factor YlaD